MIRRALRRVDDDEDGLTAGAEALVFGVLVFLVGTIIALNAWAVVDADFAVNAAAREATRSIVESAALSPEVVLATASAVAADTIAGHGKDPARAEVRVADVPWDGDRLQRCARVTVEVLYAVQGIRLPLLGSWDTPITAIGQHSELVDPLRSGLAGRAGCG